LLSGGSGTVSTTGSPVANEVPFFTAVNKIGRSPNFTYDPNTGHLVVNKAIYLKDSYFYFNPWVANGVGNIAYHFNTVYNYTGTARILSLKNYSIDKFYVLNDTAVFKNNVSIKDSVYLKKTAFVPGQVITLSPTKALKTTYLTQNIQITLTDTISKTADSLAYVQVIGSDLAGCNLIGIEAFFGKSQGTAVPVILAYRDRGTLRKNMITTGANFTTDAVINTTYDDVAKGDRITIKWTLGSGTAPYGIKIILRYKKP
jgi:hypothetical protein